MNIVMISSTFPYPPTLGGTEIRTFNLLKYLRQRHALTLVTQPYKGIPEADIEALRSWVDELVMFPLPEDEPAQAGIGNWMAKGGRFLKSIASATPPNVLHRYSPQLQAWLDDRVNSGHCDAITCEHSVNTIYVRPQYADRVKSVVNVHSSVYWGTRNFLQMGASENSLRDRLYLSTLYRYEKNYCGQFDRIVVTTPDDRTQLRKLNPNARIDIIPNGVDLELFPFRTTDPGGHQLIFVGAMHYTHNIDAVRFFVLQVMPALRERYPDTTFNIVGSRPTEEVVTLGSHPGVVVTGRVPSMVEYLHRSTVCVLPLQTGFGIKNKTLEAMAAGVPVVGSDRALEGLAADEPGTPPIALRANTVAEYVEAIGRLFDDASLRMELAKNARSPIESEFTWERSGQDYERVILGEE